MDTQLKRGLLDVCVLTAIKKEDSYGYKIIKDILPYISISESTLYPILKRMENVGFISVYTVEHNSRLRKYYSITESGINKIKEFLGEWESVMQAYSYIKEGFYNE
jgi:PadR family transcriptional regulator PadR